MASPPAHVAQSLHNEYLANHLEDKYQESTAWILTARFYAALHFIESELVQRGFSPQTHVERKRLIRTELNETGIYALYLGLETKSRLARYECSYIDQTALKHAADDLYFIKTALVGNRNEDG